MAALSTGDGFAGVVVTAVASTTDWRRPPRKRWQLLEGRERIRTLDKPFVEEFKSAVRIGGVLRKDFDEHLTRVELRRLSFMQKISTVLGRRLWDTAGSPEIDTKRLLVSISPASATTEALVFLYDDRKARGMRAASPLAVQMHMPNAPAAAVGLDRGAKAGIIALVLADASGAAAIAHAWQNTVLGEADIAICGGVEARIEAVPVAAFTQLGILSTNNDDPPGALPPLRQRSRRHGVRRRRRVAAHRNRATRQGARRPNPGPPDGGASYSVTVLPSQCL